MSQNKESQDAKIQKAFATDVISSLQCLLETKHLYQSVVVDFPTAHQIAELAPPLEGKPISPSALGSSSPSSWHRPEERKKLAVGVSKMQITALQAEAWFFQIEGIGTITHSAVHFTLPTIRIPCAFCNGVLPPHNPGFKNCVEHPHVLKVSGGLQPVAQLFSIPFQCQNCRGEPVVFHLRREGPKLQITGRSQFELVNVPKGIPKKEKEYYREAIISFNSGRGLAALFFLRTFIEQYMRRVTGNCDLQTSGDELADRYHKCLDDSFPPQFRTFRTLYGELSDRLHRAAEDSDLFLKAQRDINAHFEMLGMIPIRSGNLAEV